MWYSRGHFIENRFSKQGKLVSIFEELTHQTDKGNRVDAIKLQGPSRRASLTLGLPRLPFAVSLIARFSE